jgi:hypothetical protein
VLLNGEKGGDEGSGNTQLRWSPPGIRCESVRPTPAVMRTYCTRGTWWRETPRCVDCANGRSKCGEGLDLPHPPSIHPSDWSEWDRLSRNRGRWRQETAHCTHPTGTIAFGSSPQTLLFERTRFTVASEAQVNGTLRERIFLADFAEPEAGSGWTA